MDPRRLRTPVLVIYYNRYLTNNDCAMFVKRVARRYGNPTLERLVSVGDHITRRAAVLALSLIGDYSSNSILGRALVDHLTPPQEAGRAVNTMPDQGVSPRSPAKPHGFAELAIAGAL